MIPIQMHVDEVLPGVVPRVAEEHVLHVRERERPFQQRIIVKIHLADRPDSWQHTSRRPILRSDSAERVLGDMLSAY